MDGTNGIHGGKNEAVRSMIFLEEAMALDGDNGVGTEKENDMRRARGHRIGRHPALMKEEQRKPTSEHGHGHKSDTEHVQPRHIKRRFCVRKTC